MLHSTPSVAALLEAATERRRKRLDARKNTDRRRKIDGKNMKPKRRKQLPVKKVQLPS